MNTNTANNTTSTNTGVTGEGYGAGVNTAAGAKPGQTGTRNKIKGAYEVIHGIGENIRGTALSTIDSLAHSKKATKNEEIAHRGRLEVEQGLAKLKGNLTSAHGDVSGTPAKTGQATAQGGTASGALGHPPTAGHPQPYGIGSGVQGDVNTVQEDQSGGGVTTSNVGTAPVYDRSGGTGTGGPRLGLAGAGAEQPHHPVREAEIGACGQGGQSYHSHANYAKGGENGIGATAAHHHRDDAVTDLNAPPGQNDHGGGQASAFQGDPSTVPSYDHNDRFETMRGGGSTEVGSVPDVRGLGGETTNAGLGARHQRPSVYESASQTASSHQNYGTGSAYHNPPRGPEQATIQTNGGAAAPSEHQTFGAEQYPTSNQHKPFPHERGEPPRVVEGYGRDLAQGPPR